MFSDALEVAIGLTFVFLLVSLVMTAVVEFIESIRKTRGSGLLQGVVELLGDPGRPGSGDAAAKAVYTHPQLQGLFIGTFEGAAATKRLPSYLPSRNFALALIDQVLAGRINAAQTNASLPAHAPIGERLRLAAERVENEQLRRALKQAVAVGGDDVERIGKHLEDWFNASMDRVSGRYKRRSQHLLFWLGLVGALALNVNTLNIADSLSKDATMRRAIVAQAEKGPAGTGTGAGDVVAQLDQLGLPIGWSGGAVKSLGHAIDGTTGVRTALGWVQIVLGYVLTALAVSLGAPFWFDLLNRMMVVRTTFKPKDKPPEVAAPEVPKKKDDAAATTLAATADVLIRAIDSDIYATVPAAAEKLFEEWH